ncbi:MAG: Rne/Rng family ribonuclease [Clostridia bacterium]
MKEIIIDVQPSDTKVCIVEDGQLVEFWVERKNLTRLVGNIYKGKVMNVLQGMQAAFVNIGLERNGFLYAGDTLEFHEELANLTEKKLNLKEGDEVLCQVIKDQFGSKGARLTMNLSIPGRLLVLLPQIDYVGVSRKIVDEERRKHLIELISANKPKGLGFILRTQSEFSDDEEIVQEIAELCEKWNAIKYDYLRKKSCSLVYKDEDLAIRAVRDMLRPDVDKVVINDKKLFGEFLVAFATLHANNPQLFNLYDEEQLLFVKYKLDKQIDGLLRRRVDLSNGAYLIIDRTEALTVIDVNTGKYVGEKNLEDTVFGTNKIAAKEIARQLRLRNIGGIVIIDFIDMNDQTHVDGVLQELRDELAKDRTRTSLGEMTSFGLVELTRKKKRGMIESVMLQDCPYCKGDGYVWSDEHVIGKIKTHLGELLACNGNDAVLLTVATSVFNKLFTAQLLSKECDCEWRDKRIYVVADDNMHIEHFDVKTLKGAVLDLPDSAKMLY